MSAIFDSTCPFDCCKIWRGLIPVTTKMMGTDEYLEFMSKEKQKIITSNMACRGIPISMVVPTGPTIPPCTYQLPNKSRLSNDELLKLLAQPSKREPDSGRKNPKRPKLSFSGPPTPKPSSTAPASSATPASSTKPIKPALIIDLVICSYCGCYCLSENDLNKHLKDLHFDPKFLSCNTCGTLCVGENNLLHHEQVHRK